MEIGACNSKNQLVSQQKILQIKAAFSHLFQQSQPSLYRMKTIPHKQPFLAYRHLVQDWPITVGWQLVTDQQIWDRYGRVYKSLYKGMYIINKIFFAPWKSVSHLSDTPSLVDPSEMQWCQFPIPWILWGLLSHALLSLSLLLSGSQSLLFHGHCRQHWNW